MTQRKREMRKTGDSKNEKSTTVYNVLLCNIYLFINNVFRG